MTNLITYYRNINSPKFLLLVFTAFILSCGANKQKKVVNVDNYKLNDTSEIHPNELFQNNCAMCHAYNVTYSAPAINSYSVDSVLNYYDGKSKRDTIWEQHKKIQLTRNDWERIAIQMQPGDFFPKQQDNR